MILTKHRTVFGGGLLAASILWSLGCSTGPRVNGPRAAATSPPIATRTATIKVLGLVCPT